MSPVRSKTSTGRKKAADKKPAAGKTASKRTATAKAGGAGKKAGTKPAVKTTGERVAAAAADRLLGRNAEEYRKALEAYSACMQLVQKENWEPASRALAEFISTYSVERELAERARTYLRVCSRKLDHSVLDPQTFEDRCFLAVVLSNRGDYNDALKQLEKAAAERPKSDKVQFLTASVLALKGERKAALASLSRAIALDGRNRFYASNDPDFAVLRDDEEFITLTTLEDEEKEG